MRPFRYERPGSVQKALSAVASDPEAAFLAGGTNLVDLMKLEVVNPDRLIDIRHLVPGGIEELPDGALRIGAAVKGSELAADRRVRERYPVLAEALLAGASGQLRNAATTAGNLLQRTRCVYFYDTTTPCNKRCPGTGCSALGGYNKEHAILGASEHCVAVHPSDMAVAMTALGAVILTRSPAGERRIPVDELYRLPGNEPERDTNLSHGELVTAVELPPPGFLPNSRYRKVRDRASFAFALVSVAAALALEDGLVRDVRLALGGVAHRPWRALRAEEALRGRAASEESFRAAAEAELSGARPLAQNAYKVTLARNLIVRTLLDLSEGR